MCKTMCQRGASAGANTFFAEPWSDIPDTFPDITGHYRTFRTSFRSRSDSISGHLLDTPDRTLPDIFRTLPVTFRTVPCVRMSSFKTGHPDMIGHWSFPDTTGHTWSISGHRIRGRSAHKKNRTFHFSIFCLLDIYAKMVSTKRSHMDI